MQVTDSTETTKKHTLETEIFSEEKLISDDPAKWPSRLSNSEVQYLVQNKPNCRIQLSYPTDSNGRSFSNTYFTRKFKNGKICDRSRLLYSPSQNRIFCFCCKLFANCNSTLGNDGFYDWQHASRHLARHEKGPGHIQNFKKWINLTTAFKMETGMIDEYLIGPHILPHHITAQQFLQFLNNDLFDLLQDVPLNLRYDSWLQLNGCPAHSARIVRDWLNQSYPEKWISRWGPVGWLARSPDLTPLDFYLWGKIKNEVYSTPIESREHLIQR
ncbi:Zinc finger MYM-type protein [Ooceraea biroi]|uniref:Zinc finger MYM-type protein n=1 Tax=Ooceraea biroi TaxID=2015173 RepID=A0A026WR24_OOCBI|nr:Zinc finger MYM-type protein [Ooceraea biroi]